MNPNVEPEVFGSADAVAREVYIRAQAGGKIANDILKNQIAENLGDKLITINDNYDYYFGGGDTPNPLRAELKDAALAVTEVLDKSLSRKLELIVTAFEKSDINPGQYPTIDAAVKAAGMSIFRDAEILKDTYLQVSPLSALQTLIDDLLVLNSRDPKIVKVLEILTLDSFKSSFEASKSEPGQGGTGTENYNPGDEDPVVRRRDRELMVEEDVQKVDFVDMPNITPVTGGFSGSPNENGEQKSGASPTQSSVNLDGQAEFNMLDPGELGATSGSTPSNADAWVEFRTLDPGELGATSGSTSTNADAEA